MRPDLVLTHKQKERRFARARARKATEMASTLAQVEAGILPQKKKEKSPQQKAPKISLAPVSKISYAEPSGSRPEKRTISLDAPSGKANSSIDGVCCDKMQGGEQETMDKGSAIKVQVKLAQEVKQVSSGENASPTHDKKRVRSSSDTALEGALTEHVRLADFCKETSVTSSSMGQLDKFSPEHLISSSFQSLENQQADLFDAIPTDSLFRATMTEKNTPYAKRSFPDDGLRFNLDKGSSGEEKMTQFHKQISYEEAMCRAKMSPDCNLNPQSSLVPYRHGTDQKGNLMSWKSCPNDTKFVKTPSSLQSAIVEAVMPPSVDIQQEQDAKSTLVQILHENLVDFREMSLQLRSKLKDQDDWSALFKQNKRLFLNYIFGRYLMSPDTESQMLWLKPNKATCTVNQHLLKFTDSSELLGKTLKLFGQDAVLQNAYKGFAESLINLPVDADSKTAFAEILYYYQGQLTLTNPLLSCREFLGSIRNMPRGLDQPSLSIQAVHDVCQTLEAMSSLFEHSGLAGQFLPEYSEVVGPLDHSMFLGFTIEEEQWLCRKKDEMLEAMATISMGPEVTCEFVNFAFGGSSLSENFSLNLSYMFKERLWKVFGIHPEFKELSDANQVRIIHAAHHLFCALMAGRLDGLPMDEQAKVMYSSSELSEDFFLRSISQASPTDSLGLHSIKTRDVFPTLSTMWEEYTTRVQPLLRRKDEDMTFFAVMVATLFGCVSFNKPHWKGMEALKKKYDMVIARRFAIVGNSKVSDVDEEEEEEASLSPKVQSTVSDVRIMASMLPCTIQ